MIARLEGAVKDKKKENDQDSDTDDEAARMR